MYAISGFILIVLALPPLSVSAAAYLFFVPLLFGLERFLSNPRLATLECMLLGAAIGAYAYFGVYAEGWQLYVLCVVLSALLFAGCGYLTYRLLSLRHCWWVLFSPLIWAAGEQTVNRLGLPFELALTLDDSLVPLQLASLGGPWLVATFLLFIQTLIFLCLRFILSRQWLLIFRYGSIGVMVCLTVYGFGTYRMNHYIDANAEVKPITVAQTSLSPQLLRESAAPGRLEIIVKQHRMLQRKLGKIPTTENLITVWPESAIPGIRLSVDDDTQSLKKGFTSIIHTYALSQHADLVSETLVLDKQGELTSLSRKIRPVPFAEQAIAAGKRLVLHNSDGLPFGALICYESSFPGLARTLVGRGAKWLSVLTNDAFEWPSYLYATNFSLARMRAIENGVTVARAANGGISAIISPIGTVQASVPLFEVNVAQGSIQPLSNPTIYTRFGNLIDALFIGVALVITLVVLSLPTSSYQAVDSVTHVNSVYYLVFSAAFVLIFILAANKWQYEAMAHHYFGNLSAQAYESISRYDAGKQKKLAAALTQVLRQYGFLQSREPLSTSSDRLDVWAQAHGLKPKIGDLTSADPALRYAMTGLIKLAAGDIAVVVARDGKNFRLYFPSHKRYRWIPLQRLLRMQIGPVVWLVPTNSSSAAVRTQR